MTRFQRIFGDALPLVGVVHLPISSSYPECPGVTVAIEQLESDLAALEGMDALLLENDNDKPHTLEVCKAQVAWLTRLAVEARRRWTLPLGIGVQRIDWEATLAVAAAAELEFVRLDVFVDRVKMLDTLVTVDPAEVLALRERLGADGVALLTDIHVKHAELIGDASADGLAHSARRACSSGSDAVLISGNRTGEPPSLDDLDVARAASSVPVLVGSGLTADLADDLRAHSDGALVGTALKSGERIDAGRVQRVVTAWRSASRR
jgi:hypothetical protein